MAIDRFCSQSQQGIRGGSKYVRRDYYRHEKKYRAPAETFFDMHAETLVSRSNGVQLVAPRRFHQAAIALDCGNKTFDP
jgi:hypothetical protein